MNAPGANSTSVAELAVGLMLALARNVAAADAAMKQGKWEKKRFMGEELRERRSASSGSGGSVRRSRTARLPSACA